MGTSAIKEQELVALAIDGDNDAWAKLISKHTPRLLSFLQSRGIAEDAPDVCQSAWVIARRKLRPCATVRPLLFGVAKGIIKNLRRNSWRRVKTNSLGGDVHEHDPIDRSREDELRRVESRLFVQDILAPAALNSSDQHMVREFLRSDGNVAEIAQALQVTPSAVYKQLRRLAMKLAPKVSRPPGRF